MASGGYQVCYLVSLVLIFSCTDDEYAPTLTIMTTIKKGFNDDGDGYDSSWWEGVQVMMT